MKYSLSHFDWSVWVDYLTKGCNSRRKYFETFDEAVAWIEKNKNRIFDLECCKICTFSCTDYKVVF